MMREATAARNGQIQRVPPVMGADPALRTSWLLCRTGTMRCALPIEHVIEIMRGLPVEQVAGVPASVRGLSIIRGAPVPVVDVGCIVGGESSRGARLVTIKAASRTIALAVDEVLGIAVIAADACEELPPLLQQAATEAIGAIGALDSELLVFLRAGRLVPEDVLARLDAEGARS